MSYATKAAVLLALIASVALVACGGDDDGANTATTNGATSTNRDSSKEGKAKSSLPTIVVRDGEPVGGVEELEYSAGDQIRFSVRSDVADEVHVHGYDISQEVPAGGSVAFSFPADIEGIFEVELEERVEQIAELTVNP